MFEVRQRKEYATNLRMIRFGGKYILTDSSENEAMERFVYIGKDTFFLIGKLSGKLGRQVLEIGTGTGIIPIVFSDGRLVVATDINKRAVKMAKENLALNGTKNVRLMIANLANCFKEGSFDNIVFNSPFVPTLPSFKQTIASDGGEMGFAVFERAIGGIAAALKQGGSFYGLVMSVGDDDKPFIIDMLEDKSEHAVTLLELDKIPINNHLLFYLKRGAKIDMELCKEYYARQEISYVYYYFVTIKKSGVFKITVKKQMSRFFKRLQHDLTYAVYKLKGN